MYKEDSYKRKSNKDHHTVKVLLRDIPHEFFSDQEIGDCLSEYGKVVDVFRNTPMTAYVTFDDAAAVVYALVKPPPFLNGRTLLIQRYMRKEKERNFLGPFDAFCKRMYEIGNLPARTDLNERVERYRIEHYERPVTVTIHLIDLTVEHEKMHLYEWMQREIESDAKDHFIGNAWIFGHYNPYEKNPCENVSPMHLGLCVPDRTVTHTSVVEHDVVYAVKHVTEIGWVFVRFEGSTGVWWHLAKGLEYPAVRCEMPIVDGTIRSNGPRHEVSIRQVGQGYLTYSYVDNGTVRDIDAN